MKKKKLDREDIADMKKGTYSKKEEAKEDLDKKMMNRTNKKVKGFDDSQLRGVLVAQGAIKKRGKGRPKKGK